MKTTVEPTPNAPKRWRSGWWWTVTGLLLTLMGLVVFTLYYAVVALLFGVTDPKATNAQSSTVEVDILLGFVSPLALGALLVFLGRLSCMACPEPGGGTRAGNSAGLFPLAVVLGLGAGMLKLSAIDSPALGDWGQLLAVLAVFVWSGAELAALMFLSFIGKVRNQESLGTHSMFFGAAAVLGLFLCLVLFGLMVEEARPQTLNGLKIPRPQAEVAKTIRSTLCAVATILALLSLWYSCLIAHALRVAGTAIRSASDSDEPSQERRRSNLPAPKEVGGQAREAWRVSGGWLCRKCDTLAGQEDNFCPECGARRPSLLH